MKRHSTLAQTIALLAVLGLAAGCGKQETKAPAAPAANAPAAPADAKAAVEKAAGQAKQAAGQMAADLSAQANTMIEKAKTLIADKKYQEALTSLQQVAMSKITPEQKKTVDDLIAKAKQLMSSDAGKAIEGALKK